MPPVKRKPDPKNLEPQKFAVGETVKINRPHLWSGGVGDVVSFHGGLHRIRIVAKPDGSDCPYFHTDAKASELESFI